MKSSCLLLLFVAALYTHVNGIELSFPSSPPSSAVAAPADFVGLGFDGAFLDSYDNQFSYNLVASVANHMSVNPIVRIGGTSSDELVYDPSQQVATVCISGPCPYGAGAKYSVGPGYFDGFKAFPNSRMTFQAPTARHLNASGSLDIVTHAYAVLGANRTAAIAIGNEINFYESHSQDYVNATHQLESDIVNALGLTGSGQKIFEGAFNDGLNSNGLIILAGSHYYQVGNNTGATLQADLMNHSAIVQRFQDYKDQLSYLQAHDPSNPLALTETGSTLGNPSFAAAFGAALWAVDIQLHSLVAGISRVAGTQRPQSGHALWNPLSGVPDSPGSQVRGPFYSEIFVADFIGTNGNTKVIEMDLDSDYYSAYAAYEDGALARIAIINFHEWNTGDGTPATTTFTMKVPSAISKVQAGSLAAAAGANAGGYDVGGTSQEILYEGVQWSYKLNNGNPSGTAALESVPVSNGVITVQLPESQAVLLHFS